MDDSTRTIERCKRRRRPTLQLEFTEIVVINDPYPASFVQSRLAVA